MYQQNKLLLFFCLIFSLFSTCFTKNNIKVNNEKKPIIVFDLLNVLFKENYNGFAEKIGYGTLISYSLTHWKNPAYTCLDMLHAISKTEEQKPYLTITVKNRTLPRCLVELHEGKQTCQETRMVIQKCIEQLNNQGYFKSKKETKLMHDIMNLILDPSLTCTISEPIKPMITLVQKLKKAGYTLYLLANAPKESYDILKKSYPEIFNLFDGSVISSHINTAKPHFSIFKHLIKKYSLDPNNCILIDDLESSIATAQQLGIKGIVYTKTSSVIKKLKALGVSF